MSCWLLTALTGCGPKDGRDEIVQKGPLSIVPFAVTDFFTPSGQMGDGELPDHIIMSAGKNCMERPDQARGRCYDFLYKPANPGVHWGGVYWAYPSNNWGSEPGRKFKPWRFDPSVIDTKTQMGTLFQRYNKATFDAAADRDTFQIKLSGTDSVGKTYTLRNATFDVQGPAAQTITGDQYLGLKATDALTSPVNVTDPKAILIVKPGAYTVTLEDGWSLMAPDAMGMMAPVTATLATNSVSFSIASGVDTAATLDFNIGSDTVHFALSVPPVAVTFFAGGINDKILRGITCTDPNQVCEHIDQISTAKPIYQLTRTMQPFSMGLLISPPCVSSIDPTTNQVVNSKFADSKTGAVTCAPGTLTADGSVANCPPGRPGILNGDGTITCCDTPLVGTACTGNSSTGSWVKADDILQTVIGGFGWATNYAEFEAQAAVLSGTTTSSAGASGATSQPDLDTSPWPATTMYLDDIVWDFVQTPPPAAQP